MKPHRVFLSVVVLVLLFSFLPNFARAQDPIEDAAPAYPQAALPQGGEIEAALVTSIPVQGYLTDAGDTPLSGSHQVRLALYNLESGGSPLCQQTNTVTVDQGLFFTVLTGCADTVFNGQQLYLGVKVGSDAEMTGRQPVYAVPYARSVRPGAIINQTNTALRGLTVQSAGSGPAGTALWVENVNATSGIGLWASAAGNDATILASNTGTGALYKGFGSDGGEDEFRVNNNGSIETKADSYIFVPGSAFIKDSNTDTTRWEIAANGGAILYRGSTAGTKSVIVPLTIPNQLYGRAVKVESVTVYYKVYNSSNGYITMVYLTKSTDADSLVDLVADATDRTSTAATDFTLVPTANNVLGPNEGLILELQLSFADDAAWVLIGGVRVQLGHHGLY